MRRLFLGLLGLLAFPLCASHIVGGEFEILYLQGSTYRINMILYFDVRNGEAGARDASVTARIFRKRDNAFIDDVLLPLFSEESVPYTQPECSTGDVVTNKLIYRTTVTLSANQYNDPQGYYIVWERCCRNYSIKNIFSERPPGNTTTYPYSAGQTFYLEFPPVVKDGQPFINSTPRLFPPLNDYACPRRPYYADFAGTDDDGDSLVYTLVNPLNTHTIEALPQNGPAPAPYPEVNWRPGYGLNNIMDGEPDLRISTDGLLTVKPTEQGLYVFAVKCEEFRDGVKLGEVRRDFQLLVVDGCPIADPPQILGKKLQDADFTFDNTMAVTFPSGTSDQQRCVRVQVSDPDSRKLENGLTEQIRIKAIPIGFKKDVSAILPGQVSATLVNGSVAEFDICFDQCPLLNGPFQVGIVAYDDACSLPLFDTLKINVTVEPPPDSRPNFTSLNISEIVNEGDTRAWNISGVDADGDQLILGFVPQGFDLASVGMTYQEVSNANGSYEGLLTWDTRCDVYDFTRKTQFNIRFLLDDIETCNIFNPDTLLANLIVKLPGNAKPIIDTDLVPGINERFVNNVNVTVFETLNFNLFAYDADQDFIRLELLRSNFNPPDYGLSFNPVSGTGTLTSPLHWPILCWGDSLEKKSEFKLQFVAIDEANKCRLYQADTVDVTIKIAPPGNISPQLLISNLNNAVVFSANRMEIELGTQISLGLSGADGDQSPVDHLRLDLIEATGNVPPEGYVFAPAEGPGQVETTFTWLPECNIFQNDIYENNYTFTFNVVDDRCLNVKGDTIAIDVLIRDVDRMDELFLPPNVITPNGDGKNDYFAMERRDEQTGQLVNILPVDNCSGRFTGVTILNRWGKKIYESESRDFRWTASSEPAGVYFYFLHFTDREYKGAVSVLTGEEVAGR